MRFRQKFEELLMQNGLWENEARDVMDTAVTDPSMEAMRDRWNDFVEGYPDALLTVVWLSVKEIAITYLKENKPKHFALAILQG